MRTWYDRTGRSKNAALFKFVIVETFSRVVFTFAGDLVHFLVAVRSPYGRGWSPSGLTGVVVTVVSVHLFTVYTCTNI